MSLEDVKRRDDVDMPAERHAMTVETVCGVQVKLDIAEMDDKSWTFVSAAYVGERADEPSEEAETSKTLVDEIDARNKKPGPSKSRTMSPID